MLCSWIGSHYIINILVLLKLTYRFSVIPIKELDKLILKYICKRKGLLRWKPKWKYLPYWKSRFILKALVIKSMRYQHKISKYINGGKQISPHTYGTLIWEKRHYKKVEEGSRNHLTHRESVTAGLKILM